MKEPVYINIEFDGLTRTLPVNPENLVIKRSAENTNIDIIGIGPATRKGQPGLITMQIKSFFPSPYSQYFKYDVYAQDYIDFIYRIWETENINNKVAKLVTMGLDKNFSMWFVIDSFDYEYVGGDYDIGYTLSIKEYVPYGARTITIPQEGMGEDRPASTTTVPENNENKTYVVQSGDTLWSIAKRCVGDGSKWNALYELNKDVIGTNPNYIKIGTVLTLPENWDSPKVVTTKKTKANSGTKTQPKAVTTNTLDVTEIRTDAQIERDAALKEYFETHKKVENLLNNIENNKDNYPWYTSISLSSDKFNVQESYKKVAKASGNPNLTMQQQLDAIKEQKELENRLYSRFISTYIPDNGHHF